FGPKGLQIITVTSDDPSIVPEFIQQHRVNYGVVAHKSMGQLWGVIGIPASFLVNREGKVVWKGHPSSLYDRMLYQHMGLPATSSDVLSTTTVTEVDSDGSEKWLLGMVGAAVFFAGAMFFFWWKTRTPKWKPDYAAFDPKEVKKQQIREQMAQHDPQQAPKDGVADSGNTSSTGSFVRPSTDSIPALSSDGPHGKPRLGRTDGHLSSGALQSSPGSTPQPPPPPQSAPKGNTQFRPYDPQQGQ
ncbi:MAG: TlpA disulfide reductase family protein, partial [Planctomycetota bacterium]